MLVALPRGAPARAPPAIDLAELRDEEWLLPWTAARAPDSSVILRACDRAGFEPNIHFQSEDYQALQGLTASGMGVALIPTLATMSLRTDIVLRPVAGDAAHAPHPRARAGAGETTRRRRGGRRAAPRRPPAHARHRPARSPAVAEPGDAAHPAAPGRGRASSARAARCCALADRLVPAEFAMFLLSVDFMYSRALGTFAELGLADELDDGPGDRGASWPRGSTSTPTRCTACCGCSRCAASCS